MVLRHHQSVDAPVIGIYPLISVAFGAVDFVEVDFFEVGFQQRAIRRDTVYVVFVRRVARPVARRRVDFHAHQPLAVEARRDDTVDLP